MLKIRIEINAKQVFYFALTLISAIATICSVLMVLRFHEAIQPLLEENLFLSGILLPWIPYIYFLYWATMAFFCTWWKKGRENLGSWKAKGIKESLRPGTVLSLFSGLFLVTSTYCMHSPSVAAITKEILVGMATMLVLLSMLSLASAMFLGARGAWNEIRGRRHVGI